MKREIYDRMLQWSACTVALDSLFSIILTIAFLILLLASIISCAYAMLSWLMSDTPYYSHISCILIFPSSANLLMHLTWRH